MNLCANFKPPCEVIDMYKTNSTNSANSAIKAKSYALLQQDLWENENKSYHPDFLMIEQVFDHYHQTLKLQPKLSEILVSRKIDPDYVDRFHIGFADRTLGFELLSPRCLLGSRNRGHLQRLGLLKSSGHEFFRGAMVFPYRNVDGQIVGAYGRRPGQQPRSPNYHLFWNAQQVTFFNVLNQCLPSSLILCKSGLDALTLLTVGIENVVASMGVRGFNDIQLSRLLEDGVRHVYIAFDNTPSANNYARLVAQALDAIDILCFRVKLPLGQDVNQFSISKIDVAAEFNYLLKTAVPFKQRHGNLVPGFKDYWLTKLTTIEDSIAFFLEDKKQTGKALRTLNANRIHLVRFQEYCFEIGIKELMELNAEVLERYRRYLEKDKNVFTGKVISSVTQMERMSAVSQMLSRLYYYDLISEPLAFVTRHG